MSSWVATNIHRQPAIVRTEQKAMKCAKSLHQGAMAIGVLAVIGALVWVAAAYNVHDTTATILGQSITTSTGSTERIYDFTLAATSLIGGLITAGVLAALGYMVELLALRTDANEG